MTSRHILLLLSVLLAAPFTRAQTTAPGSPKPILFRLVAWNFDLPGLFYEQDGKKHPLPVRQRALSELQTYTGPARVVFYTETSGPQGSVKTPVAEATLLPPPQRNLVVLLLRKRGECEAAVLADDPQIPPPGAVRFLNFTAKNLALQCRGQDRFILAPGEARVVPAQKGGMGIGIGVMVARQAKKSDPDSWQLALMSGISLAPDERITAFIMDPEHLALTAQEKSLVGHVEKEQLGFLLIRDTVPVAK